MLTHNKDADGTNHYRYQQTFRGIPVFGEQVIVSEDKAGNVRNLFGRSIGGLAGELPSTSAKLARAQAMSIAKAATLGNRIARNESAPQRSERVCRASEGLLRAHTLLSPVQALHFTHEGQQ